VDIARFLAVARRRWYVVVPGFLVAVVAAVVAVANVDLAHRTISWRAKSTFSSSVVLLVTEDGGPELRAALPTVDVTTPKATTKTTKTPADAQATFGDPNRLNYLAGLLAYFVKSDAVCERIGVAACVPSDTGHTRISAQVLASAAAVEQTGSNGFPSGLPLIEVTGEADTADGAIRLASDAASALEAYVTTRQATERVPLDQGVRVELNRSARRATLVQGPSKTPAIAAFGLVILMTFGIAFTLENLRGRPAPATAEAADAPGDAPADAASEAASVASATLGRPFALVATTRRPGRDG